MMRRLLSQHSMAECPKRTQPCKYCGKEFVFDTIQVSLSSESLVTVLTSALILSSHWRNLFIFGMIELVKCQVFSPVMWLAEGSQSCSSKMLVWAAVLLYGLLYGSTHMARAWTDRVTLPSPTLWAQDPKIKSRFPPSCLVSTSVCLYKQQLESEFFRPLMWHLKKFYDFMEV